MVDEARGSNAFQVIDGQIGVRLNLNVYRLFAIQKAAYRLAERCTAVLGEPRDEHLEVRFAFRPGTGEDQAREAVRQFFQELLDQELREKVGEETGPLRHLVIAQAFSRTDLIRRE
jgi:His-Xaa-Ser system protein HxsD